MIGGSQLAAMNSLHRLSTIPSVINKPRHVPYDQAGAVKNGISCGCLCEPLIGPTPSQSYVIRKKIISTEREREREGEGERERERERERGERERERESQGKGLQSCLFIVSYNLQRIVRLNIIFMNSFGRF